MGATMVDPAATKEMAHARGAGVTAAVVTVPRRSASGVYPPPPPIPPYPPFRSSLTRPHPPTVLRHRASGAAAYSSIASTHTVLTIGSPVTETSVSRTTASAATAPAADGSASVTGVSPALSAAA